MDSSGVLICGAGIVGLTLARELSERGIRGITVIEKEEAPGAHASGRMSGALHSGVYYSPGSLRAECAARGNRLMKEFCRRKGLSLVEAGKVIVARDARALVKGLEPADLEPCEKAGIRPQLVDWERKELLTDFVIRKTGESMHILNAISPAFTCSMEFASLAADEFLSGKGGPHDGRDNTGGRAWHEAQGRGA